MNGIVQIQWTAPSLEEARKISTQLVSQRLVACANLIPSVESIYLWKGALETAQEVKVFLKTHRELFPQIRDFIQKNCSYEVPEISCLAFEEGNTAYFEWILGSVVDCGSFDDTP